MPKSIWKGVVLLGIISVPVKLYPAVSEKDLAFTTLHASCRSRLNQKRWCPVDNREVKPEEIVRVFEVTKGDYVEVTDEDLDGLPVGSKQTISLTDIVEHGEVPLFPEKTYYLEPELVGAKPYLLLCRALAQLGVMGIGKLSLRSKERMVAVRPHGDKLLVDMLYWPDEINELDSGNRDSRQPKPELDPGEVSLVAQFIGQLRRPYDPSHYTNEYRARLLELIEAKRNQLPMPARIEAPAAGSPSDLMNMLRVAVEQGRQAQEEPVAELPEPTPIKSRKPRKPRQEAVAF